MKENRVKRILYEGRLALGTHLGGIADPQIVELIGLAGFDAAFIDMEHTSFDLHHVQLAVMAAERVGITPIVRTPGFDPAFCPPRDGSRRRDVRHPLHGDSARDRLCHASGRIVPGRLGRSRGC